MVVLDNRTFRLTHAQFVRARVQADAHSQPSIEHATVALKQVSLPARCARSHPPNLVTGEHQMAASKNEYACLHVIHLNFMARVVCWSRGIEGDRNVRWRSRGWR